MLTLTIAALIVFCLTTIVGLAGIGAAFVIIPFFYWLGIPLGTAMATALLLNSISMSVASITYIRSRLVVFHTAIPVILLAMVFSPLGAYTTQLLPRKVLLWLFVGFLIFAGSMMLFFRPHAKGAERSQRQNLTFGGLLGAGEGYVGGLLGVGGGNFIVPALIWFGIDPRKAAATSAFIVIFSSLAAFFGHAAIGNVNLTLFGCSAIASVAGGLLASWLVSFKLKPRHVKFVFAILVYLIAAKMIWGLVS